MAKRIFYEIKNRVFILPYCSISPNREGLPWHDGEKQDRPNDCHLPSKLTTTYGIIKDRAAVHSLEPHQFAKRFLPHNKCT